jgi:pimeloyl-ACP methyl ester carboxylesterase
LAASEKNPATGAIDWQHALDPAVNAQASTLPGASLVVSRLAKFIAETQGTPPEVHLVGHSAGSIFLGAMLDRLADAKIPVSSLTYMAPAIRTDDFLKSVKPHLGKNVQHFTSFAMSDQLELDDTCAGVYHKSLLYLVSRAFEPKVGERPVPILGMKRHATTSVGGTTFKDAVAAVGGSLVWSPSQTPTISRSAAHSHGGFDDDSATMTSVMLRLLGKATIAKPNVYAPNAPRLGLLSKDA